MNDQPFFLKLDFVHFCPPVVIPLFITSRADQSSANCSRTEVFIL